VFRRHVVTLVHASIVCVVMTAAAVVCLAQNLPERLNGVPSSPRSPVRASIGDMSWLAGEWVSSGSPTTIEERWTPPAGGAMLGVARTLSGDRTKERRQGVPIDMVEFEFLRIVQRDGGLVYVAQPGGRPPTEFVLTMFSKDSATFENPAHDFPRVIRYALRANGTLEATISDGGQKARTFTFARRAH
jgi:hypothetical protein